MGLQNCEGGGGELTGAGGGNNYCVLVVGEEFLRLAYGGYYGFVGGAGVYESDGLVEVFVADDYGVAHIEEMFPMGGIIGEVDQVGGVQSLLPMAEAEAVLRR